MEINLENEYVVAIAYVLVVANYTSFALFVVAFWPIGGYGAILYISYFLLLVLVHIVNMTLFDVNVLRGISLFATTKTLLKVNAWIFWWPCVFLKELDKVFWSYDIRSRIFLKITETTERYKPYFLISKSIILIALLATSASIADSKFQIQMTWISFSLLTIFTYYQMTWVRGIFEIVMVFFMYLVVLTINCLLIPWILMWDWKIINTRPIPECKSLNYRITRYLQHQLTLSLDQPELRPAGSNEDSSSEVESSQSNNENGGNDTSFSKVKRQQTMKVMGNMMSEWKRGFSLRDKSKVVSCSVWLDEFNKGDEVIELHCGKSHIFHPNCIEDWAMRNKSCPLWRTDFVELARKEQAEKVKKDTQNPKEDEKRKELEQNSVKVNKPPSVRYQVDNSTYIPISPAAINIPDDVIDPDDISISDNVHP